ncbi:MAG: efflux RND transporter periplasmic adaptor subunit [Nitrospirota bacterium]
MNKKTRLIKISMTIFIVTAIAVTGIYGLSKNGKQGQGNMNSSPQIITVAPQPVSLTISLQGILEPARMISIISPLNSRVTEKYFYYGEHVKRGQLLLKLDTSETEIKLREAKVAYAKAVEHLKELEEWENRPEVSRVRRSLTKAKLSLDAQKKRLEDTEMLFKKGIVAASEYESTLEQYKNLQLDYQSAQEELNAVLTKGSGENIKIARLEVESARLRLRELEDTLKKALVHAPVSGIVLLPHVNRDEQDEKKKILEAGSIVARGETLLTIGDSNSLSVRTQIDEVDKPKIMHGQKVRITGDAFPKVVLTGKIHYISSQARVLNKTPYFDVVVMIDKIPPEFEKSIDIGMSANIEVIIYEKTDTLMVPISAVKIKGHERWVIMLDKENNQFKKIKVETGITTTDSVEITGGLKAGDKVVLETK